MELVYTNTKIDSEKMTKAKVITISSGKGGVGKTSTATNLALSLSILGQKVCVFDADTSLANINILLGIHPEFTLQHLLKGEKTLNEIIIDGPRGLKVIPGATGIAEYASLSADQRNILLTALDKLQHEFDYLIIDTAAGIGDDVLNFINASQFPIVVITPEPTSLTDSFSLLKVLKRSGFKRKSYILVNMAMDFKNSQTIYKRFESAVKKYIDVDISYLGFVQVDETIISSVSLQCPAVLLSPDCIASKCFKTLANSLKEKFDENKIESFSDYWREQNIVPIESSKEIIEKTAVPLSEITDDQESVESSFDNAANICIEQLNNGELNNELVKPVVDSIIKSYKKTYQAEVVEKQSSTSSLSDFYNYIEEEGFPKEIIKDVIFTLEQIFYEQNKESLRSFESNVTYLFSQFNGSEKELKFLHEKLCQFFLRQFEKPLYNVALELEKESLKESFSKSNFDNLLKELLVNYQTRFEEQYKTQANIDLEEALLKIEKVNAENLKLQEKLEISEEVIEQQKMVLGKIQNLLIKEELNE